MENTKIRIQDIDETTDETRADHASQWDQDWYKVVEDMHHCATFCMRDELADLLIDGLAIVDKSGDLEPGERQEWLRIIESVKALTIDTASEIVSGMTQAQKAEVVRVTQAYLMRCCEKIMKVMQSYTDRHE